MATKNQYETARHQHLSVGYDLAQKFLTGDKHLSAVTDDLSGRGAKMLHRKLVNMTGQWQSISRADNIDRLSTIIDALAFNYAGEKRDFHEFQALIEDEVAGFVVTAHPTFAMSKEAWAYAQDFMNGLPKSIKTPPSDDEVMQVHPDTSPTLHEELEYAKVALTNMRRALRTLYKVVFDRAAVLYPNEYRQLKPSLATIASWVGFDLDGRTDIDWSLGLLFRYRTAITGLNHCIEAAKILDIDDKLAGEHLEAIRSGFATLLSCFELGERELKSYQDDDQTLINFNVLTVKNQALKETARAEIAAALDALLAAPLAPADWRDVALLSTEWHSVGLGLSHIHFRLNAAQLHNAMGPEINLTKAPDQSAMRRHFLAAISDKLATVKPQSIHYGNLAAERTTAKRVFMMAAQFQKHFDAATPIRMLVAESDTPFTLLAALYYAKLFDVEAHVEISPLFETAIGLERGDRVIAELIDNPHFLAYIQNQGRFCIQLGFSDSGRYIGQPAASLAIERFKLRVVRLWKARGLGDIQLLFFDTHGESIGRGAYPESLKKRFLYTHPPRVRQALAELRRPEKHEVSFQGGEGYLWFLSEDTMKIGFMMKKVGRSISS
jgi:phosphoenolpyruvate carboxylase